METIHGLKNNGPAIIGTGLAFTVLTAVTVMLRFISKRLTKASYGFDDWSILSTLPIYVITEILVVRSDFVGRAARSPDDNRYQVYQQLVYIYSIFYFPVVVLSQTSILLFYRRIFFPSYFRHSTIALMLLIAAWLLIALLIEIGYPGHPISSYFPGSSNVTFKVNYLTFWIVMAILENLISMAILILPIRELHLLNLSLRKKLAVASMFALGGFVIITGIVRMAVLYRPNDEDIDLTKGDVWLNVHLGTAIISACLPTFRPLMEYLKPKKQQTSYYLEDSAVKRWQRAPASPESLENIHAASSGGEQTNDTVEARRSECSISLIDLQGRDRSSGEARTVTPAEQIVDVV